MTQKIRGLASLVMVVLALVHIPITSKIPYDEGMALEIIKASYLPVIELVKELEETDDPQLLRLPPNIKSENDFVAVVAYNMEDRLAEKIYEDWIIEKEGQLYAKSSYYIPTIYDDSREITKAYIAEQETLMDKLRNQKDLDSRELIIKERQKIYDTSYHKRTYHYALDGDNNLVLEHVNGTTSMGFAEVTKNPWYKLWQQTK